MNNLFGPPIKVLPEGRDPLQPPGAPRKAKRGWLFWLAVAGVLGPAMTCLIIGGAQRIPAAFGMGPTDTPTPTATVTAPVGATFDYATPNAAQMGITRLPTFTPNWQASVTAVFGQLLATGTPTVERPTEFVTMGPPTIAGMPYFYSPGGQAEPSPTVDMSFNNLIGLFPTPTQFPASMQTLMAILPTYTPLATYTPFPTWTKPPPTAYPAQATYTPLPTFTPVAPTQTPWVIYVTVVVTATPTETPAPTATLEATVEPPTATPTETPTP